MNEEAQETILALERWINEHPVLAEDGQPMVWADGRPVALDVADALWAIHRLKVLQALAWGDHGKAD